VVDAVACGLETPELGNMGKLAAAEWSVPRPSLCSIGVSGQKRLQVVLGWV
jgi:hypothetical protein